MKTSQPIYTAFVDLAWWTFGRTADSSKSARFTCERRLDGTTLDALLLAVPTAHSGASQREERSGASRSTRCRTCHVSQGPFAP
jgi:hypothetical protein